MRNCEIPQSRAGLAAPVGIAAWLPNRGLGEWRNVTLRHFNRLLPQHHAQQADERNQRRSRGPHMDKAVGHANGETMTRETR
jgi:hypothetical protein